MDSIYRDCFASSRNDNCVSESCQVGNLNLREGFFEIYVLT